MARDSCHVLSTEPGISPPHPDSPAQGLAGFGPARQTSLPRLTRWDSSASSPPYTPGAATTMGGQGIAGGACRGAPLFHDPGHLGLCFREMHPSVRDTEKLRHRAHFAPRPSSTSPCTKYQRSFPENCHHLTGGEGCGWSLVSPHLLWLLGTADGGRGQLSCPRVCQAQNSAVQAAEQSPSLCAPRHRHALPQPPPHPLRPGR